MKKILPILLILLGIGAGAGAGLMLKPAPQEVAAINPCGDTEMAADSHAAPEHQEEVEADPATKEYIKMHDQFIVPVVTQERVGALVVVSISLEIEPGRSDVVYGREPKLRDAFLQVMFDHANMGGFEGSFTSSNNLDVLRAALYRVASKSLGPLVSDVLITDIARQDS
jgi:flagellar protein FliL